MRIFTIQVGKWRLAKQHDIFFLDTTVKSGYSLFAPTWDMVMGHKHGTLLDEEYKKLYRDMLIRSWKERREEWLKVLKDETPTALACYCKPGAFCHRLLLKDFLQQLCKQLDIPFEYYGELTDALIENKEDNVQRT
jgi:uncharacterized protein YeaO (DUF488 family)